MKMHLAAALLSLLPVAGLATTGETVAVVQRAIIESNGEKVTLNVGRPVALGDTIATSSGGEAQIIFPDQTRIVVGPNSQLTISKLLFRDSGKAKRLSVNAVRGTFRFLSGESPSNAYSIRTPTATMGVRGTAFDFAVTGRANTDLVVYSGRVQFCSGGRCATVPGGCQAVRVDRQGVFSQPATALERRETLDQAFPYYDNQENLQPRFRTATDSCSEITNLALAVPQIALPSGRSSDGQGSDTGGRETGNPAD